MATHTTPGPWIWTGIYVEDAEGIVIADILSEANANASLIAAAPDLLAALQAMVDRWEPDCVGTDRRMWDDARAAIAKATKDVA